MKRNASDCTGTNKQLRTCSSTVTLEAILDLIARQQVVDLSRFLDAASLLSLGATSKTVFHLAEIVVSRKLWFFGDRGLFVWHRPRKIVLKDSTDYHRFITSCLADTVENLRFHDSFASYIDRLPPRLTNLSIGVKTFVTFHSLPATLRVLLIPISKLALMTGGDRRLPPLLRKLYIVEDDNPDDAPLPLGLLDRLPEGLEVLRINRHVPFNQPIDSLPGSLTHLVLPHEFNQPVDKLPERLEKVVFYRFFNQAVDRLPKGLKHLYLWGYYFDHPLDNLPAGLYTLVLGHSFDHPIDMLPKGLVFLVLGDNFNRPVDRLPVSLQYLRTGMCFKRGVDHLPKNLKLLLLGDFFDCPVDNLPAGLKELTVGSMFNQPLDRLPASLEKLNVGFSFDRPLLNLPKGLLWLTLGEKASVSRCPIKIPESVVRLSFYQDKSDKPDPGRRVICATSAYFARPPRNAPELRCESIHHFEYVHFPTKSIKWFRMICE